MPKKIFLFIIVAILLSASQGNCIEWKWFQGRLEQETATYLMIPGVSLTAAQTIALDTNIKSIKYGAGITLSSITMNRSDVPGTAFITNPSIDLRPYVGFKITLNDTGTGAVGWIKAAGTGQEQGDTLITNGTFTANVNNWSVTAPSTLAWNAGGYADIARNSGTIYTQCSQEIINASGVLLYTSVNTIAANFNTVMVNSIGDYFINTTGTGVHSGYRVATQNNHTIFVGGGGSVVATVSVDDIIVKQVLTPSTTGVIIWDLTAQNWVTVGSTPNVASFVATITRN